jgi:hypothetical protein
MCDALTCATVFKSCSADWHGAALNGRQSLNLEDNASMLCDCSVFVILYAIGNKGVRCL